ncbi:hypothetical protein GDO78_012575 [Eleutherodactylus coqui]|uniref:Cadherin domain-containing protein n=1 Tax=Eleutherodactylus coqui TaxID=57060 RepID=A0A8J6F0V3_ELECQ|nr:hypothetical protein GDO78_012575 [Eleutherodactylus coqui]
MRGPPVTSYDVTCSMDLCGARMSYLLQVNKGKDKKGQISWEDHQEHHYKRQKREWVAPPVNIREGQDNRKDNPIAKVHSDMGVKKGVLRYSVSGHGVNLPPYGIFIIDSITGYLNVTGVIVDREEIPMFYLTVHAYTLSGVEVEKPLQLRVRVMDINDNPPIFSLGVFQGSVEENCRANTLVMQITATDADEEDTANSIIAYRIISQNPSNPQMFLMNRHTGQVFTMSNSLDREAVSGYSLSVGGTDLDGAAGGLSGECGASITILDVNDNFPTLEYDSYSVAIQENMVGFSDLRMKVFDLDEMYSDNWIASFEIVSGNEGGWFAIETDAQTNEGCLKVVKALDYESMQAMNLAILVKNRAAFHQSVMSQYKAKANSISVQVQNVKEGYVFRPSNINVQIPKGLSAQELIQYVLTRVVALDIDTGGPATNVVYQLDQASSKWFIIDSKTGEIRMTYELIQETLNNNANNNGGNNNIGDKNYTAIIHALDENTAARLTPTSNLRPGNYSVPVYVTDRNNTSCRNVSLGPAAIGLMVLGFLALLLALLLLPLCVCGSGGGGGGFVPVVEAYDGAFHAWGTEGAQPEDVKAELYANEDESRPANDCLLIYDNEGMGSPVGSVGCCSFIADDLDDTFLDTLGPKFKTLAEICIGSEIEPLSSAGEPRLFPNIPIIETEASVLLDESTVNVAANRSMPVSSTTYVTESSMSSANLQPVRSMPETFIPGNVLVTETYTTSGGTLRPVVRNVDPGLPTNILVTERLVESTAAGGMAAGHGGFPDLHNGSNVIVTERVVRPVSGAHEFIELPNLAETSNVVLRERVVAPNSSRLSNTFNISDLGNAQNVVLTERVVAPNSSRMPNSFNISDLGDAQNVVVTERLIQPISNVQGNLSIRPEMGSSQNIYVTEKTVRSGPAIKTQMLSAEPLLTQTVGSTSPSLTRSKVTKYSTVQYTKQ